MYQLSQMPIINLDAADLTADDRELANQIVKPDGSLYANKPCKASGEAKYLWRMVAFTISHKAVHHCLPVMAEMDIPGSCSETWAITQRLDALADRIIAAAPLKDHHGTTSWARVMGVF